MPGIIAKARVFATLWPAIKPIDRDVFMRMANGEGLTMDNANEIYEWHEETRRGLDMLSEALDEATNDIGNIPIASFFGQIKAGDLESSDDPEGNPVERSVFLKASETDIPFNWLQSDLRFSKVVFGPGSGVPQHYVIVDPADANITQAKLEPEGESAILTSSNVCRPFDMAGTKLQVGEWRVSNEGAWEFWPSSIAEDVWVMLLQYLPPWSFM